MDFYSMEPWGAEVEWLRTGTIASIIINTNRTKRGGKTYKPQDFLPKMKRRPRKHNATPQSTGDRLMNRFVAVFGDRMKPAGNDEG